MSWVLDLVDCFLSCQGNHAAYSSFSSHVFHIVDVSQCYFRIGSLISCRRNLHVFRESFLFLYRDLWIQIFHYLLQQRLLQLEPLPFGRILRRFPRIGDVEVGDRVFDLLLARQPILIVLFGRLLAMWPRLLTLTGCHWGVDLVLSVCRHVR